MNSQSSTDDKSTRQRAYVLAVLIVGLVAMAAAWRWSALSEYLDVKNSVAMLRSSGFIQVPIVAVTLVFLACIVAVPLSVVIVFAAFVYGAMLGPLYVLIGAEIGAAISFALGKYLGHSALQRFAGEKASVLSHQLGKNGMISVFIIRLVPAAPFAIVNMVVGASHIRMRDFLLGTALGMIPGIVMITLFVDQIVAAVLVPGWRSILLVVAVLLLLVVGSFVLKAWVKTSRGE